MLSNQANFWARAWPKMAVCLQSVIRLDTWLWSSGFKENKGLGGVLSLAGS